jgi:hypothetical protein
MKYNAAAGRSGIDFLQGKDFYFCLRLLSSPCQSNYLTTALPPIKFHGLEQV